MSHLECRMYEAEYPEVDTPVMVKVKSIKKEAVHVELLEYGNAEAIILVTDLCRRRIRSVGSVIKVGRSEPAMVLRVDEEKGHIDLSKKTLSKRDVRVCEERFGKSKLVHSVLCHVAESLGLHLQDLYVHVGWPLYRKYGHAFEAFKLIVYDPDSVLDSLTREVKSIGADGREVTKVVPAIPEDVKHALVRDIRRRMARQQVRIRADIVMTCFEFDGVLHIKEAMRKAEAASTKECPVKIKLVAAPAYVLTTQTFDKEVGISVLRNAIAACTEAIESHKGKLVVKSAPRAVAEEDDDKEISEQVGKLSVENKEVSSEDEEDSGTDCDQEKSSSWVDDWGRRAKGA